MGKEIIKSLKTVRDNITFFEKFNWQIIERGYSLYIYKTNITRSGALVVDCSMNIDLELKLMGFKGAKKMMEMKPKTLTFDFILTQMKNLEKQNVVDPIVDHGAIVQGQISSNVSAAANIPFYGPVANSVAKCNECNRTFASSKCLQDHNKSKHGPHKCGMCKFGFPTISELHSHVPKCRKKKQALKKHTAGPSGSMLQAVRGPLPDLHKCSLCEMQFASHIDLVEHQVAHQAMQQGVLTRYQGFSQVSFGLSNENFH